MNCNACDEPLSDKRLRGLTLMFCSTAHPQIPTHRRLCLNCAERRTKRLMLATMADGTEVIAPEAEAAIGKWEEVPL